MDIEVLYGDRTCRTNIFNKNQENLCIEASGQCAQNPYLLMNDPWHRGLTSMAVTESAPILAAIMASKPVPVPMSRTCTSSPSDLFLAIAADKPT
jgi:hypothetical protein